MAYVQALSHLVARSMTEIGIPVLDLQNAASERLGDVVDLLGEESDAVFDTIVAGNPFAPEVLGRFVEVARRLVGGATCGEAG